MNYGLEDNQNEKKIQAPKRVKLKKKKDIMKCHNQGYKVMGIRKYTDQAKQRDNKGLL